MWQFGGALPCRSARSTSAGRVDLSIFARDNASVIGIISPDSVIVSAPAKNATSASPVQSTTTLARIDLRPPFVLTNRPCDAISLSYRIGCAEVDQVVRAEKALICSLNKE